MRSIEKGILLAEFINPSFTSREQIDSLVEWIRKQDAYQNLLKNITEIRRSSTKISEVIYQEFRSIDLDSINSIEEGLVCYSKILYLSSISTPNYYTNPLLVINKLERSIKLKDVVVKFNEKYMSLEVLVENNDFSFAEKYEFICEKINSWKKEVFEKILVPINKIKEINPRNLPKINLFSIGKSLELLLILFFFGFICLGLISNDKKYQSYFYNYNFQTYDANNFIYLIFVFFLVLLSLSFIVEILITLFKYHNYNRYRNFLFDEKKLINYIDNNADKLKDYLISSISNKSKMTAKIVYFSQSFKVYEYFLYLYYVNYKCKKIKQPKFSKFNLILVILTIIFWLCFLIVLMM